MTEHELRHASPEQVSKLLTPLKGLTLRGREVASPFLVIWPEGSYCKYTLVCNLCLPAALPPDASAAFRLVYAIFHSNEEVFVNCKNEAELLKVLRNPTEAEWWFHDEVG
jgi:hypothetical protein